jgi:HSP20 family protein
MRSLQNEINRLFEDDLLNSETPSVNIWGDEDKLVLTAELPGITPEDIDVSIQGEHLKLEGERKFDGPEDTTCHRRERGFGKFVRSFKLPFDVESEKVSASYKNGVLTLTMPRAEKSKPKRITVKSE